MWWYLEMMAVVLEYGLMCVEVAVRLRTGGGECIPVALVALFFRVIARAPHFSKQ
jgi:hypothetical protein